MFVDLISEMVCTPTWGMPIFTSTGHLRSKQWQFTELRFSRLCGWGLVGASWDSDPSVGMAKHPDRFPNRCPIPGCMDR